MIYIRDLFEETCQTIDIHNPTSSNEILDKYTLEEWVKKQGAGETALASVKIWTRAMLGLEPSDMSALFFLDYCKSGGGLMQMRSDKKNGGQYFRLAQGKRNFWTVLKTGAYLKTTRNSSHFAWSRKFIIRRVSHSELACTSYRTGA